MAAGCIGRAGGRAEGEFRPGWGRYFLQRNQPGARVAGPCYWAQCMIPTSLALFSQLAICEVRMRTPLRIAGRIKRFCPRHQALSWCLRPRYPRRALGHGFSAENLMALSKLPVLSTCSPSLCSRGLDEPVRARGQP